MRQTWSGPDSAQRNSDRNLSADKIGSGVRSGKKEKVPSLGRGSVRWRVHHGGHDSFSERDG